MCYHTKDRHFITSCHHIHLKVLDSIVSLTSLASATVNTHKKETTFILQVHKSKPSQIFNHVHDSLVPKCEHTIFRGPGIWYIGNWYSNSVSWYRWQWPICYRKPYRYRYIYIRFKPINMQSKMLSYCIGCWRMAQVTQVAMMYPTEHMT